MKRTCLIAGLVLLPVIARGQHLRVSPGSHDFGRVLQHSKVSCTFVVENTTDHPVKLTRVKANCGCTVPVPARTELKPGEQTRIDVTFDAGIFVGEQEKLVYIDTDEPQRYTVFVYADVVREYSFEPSLLRLQAGEGLQKRAVHLVSNMQGKVFRITDAKTDSGCISVRVNKTGDAMEVTLPAKADCGGEQEIRVTLSGRDEPVSFPVIVERKDDVQAIPRVLMFMGVKAGTEVKRGCRFKFADKSDEWHVVSASSDLDFLAVDAIEKQSLKMRTVPDRMKRGYGKGKLSVVLAGPKGVKRTIIVPVAYNIF